jgi:L,D-transpeptidase ErfK/SrfK
MFHTEASMPHASISTRTVLLHVLTVALASAALCGAGAQNAPARSPLVGGEWIHAAVSGESWATIGAREGVAPSVLAARNGRTLKSPLKAGEILVIDNRHIVPDANAAPEGNDIVVNVPQRLLFLFADGRLQASYPVAVGGRNWQTPLGDFAIVLREENPTWDVPASIQEEMRRAGKRVLTRVPPGPTNPLGKYWLGLSLDAVGIHGTIAPLSIYSFATHGCIRLHPDDIEDLYAQVAEGDPGRIVYEPVLVALDGGDVYLEVHRDPYGLVPDLLQRATDLLDAAGLGAMTDREEVARTVRLAEGIATPVTRLRP